VIEIRKKYELEQFRENLYKKGMTIELDELATKIKNAKGCQQQEEDLGRWQLSR
jgi:hypothetical protein